MTQVKTNTFSPREIVGELDRYIVGQNEAKRAVAIALRNRWRRQQLSGDMRQEVTPKMSSQEVCMYHLRCCVKG